MLKTILVPLDGSPVAETALEPATLLARRFDAELLLVHTTYADESPEQADQSEQMRRAPNAQAYLDAVAGHLRSEGVSARTALLPAKPVEGIVDEAGLSRADLIVMTTRGRRGLDALLHPSVTWQVLRQSDAPILARKSAGDDDPGMSVRPLLRFMTDPQTPILVPLDGSPQAEIALLLAQELARVFGNPLLLARAPEMPLPPLAAGAGVGPIAIGGDSLMIAQAAQQAEEEARSYLERKRAELFSAGLRAEIVVGPGPAAAFIQEAARRYQAGLIVMASHGRGWLGRLVLGSVAQSVLHDVDIPILLVRRQAPADADQASDRPAEHLPSA